MIAVLSRAEGEKQWKIESDARTITRYMEIAADESRLKNAHGFLEKERDKMNAALTSMEISKNIISATGRKVN